MLYLLFLGYAGFQRVFAAGPRARVVDPDRGPDRVGH